MKINFFRKAQITTFEGGPAKTLSPLSQLRRLVMASMLWEDQFYIDGQSSAGLIEQVCDKVKPEQIVSLASEAHSKGLLRHMPLFLIVQALKKGARCAETIANICNRPDQMTELLSLYWKDGKKPLAAQLKKGLAKAFQRFDAYQLAKYNRDVPIKLRDVLFMCHAKPKDIPQGLLWKKLVDKTLKPADTWENRLSAGKDKKQSFQELLEHNKIGKLAILRNVRNMQEAGVPKELIELRLNGSKQPLLPFQFLAAAKMCPQWEDMIDYAMVQSALGRERLPGHTVILVDVSGSMDHILSRKSVMSRKDAAAGLAILLRERCSDVEFFSFSDNIEYVPPRHGMALRDAIFSSQRSGSTLLGQALRFLDAHRRSRVPIDRLIVITDEQIQDAIPAMKIDKCYMLNIAGYQNGVSTQSNWTTISGFSENVIDYIQEIEKESLDNQ